MQLGRSSPTPHRSKRPLELSDGDGDVRMIGREMSSSPTKKRRVNNNNMSSSSSSSSNSNNHNNSNNEHGDQELVDENGDRDILRAFWKKASRFGKEVFMNWALQGSTEEHLTAKHETGNSQPMRQINGNFINSSTPVDDSKLTMHHSQDEDHPHLHDERPTPSRLGSVGASPADIIRAPMERYPTSSNHLPTSSTPSPPSPPSPHTDSHSLPDGMSPNRPISISSSPAQSPSSTAGNETGSFRPAARQTPSFSTYPSRTVVRGRSGFTSQNLEIVPLETTTLRSWLSSPSRGSQISPPLSPGRYSAQSHSTMRSSQKQHSEEQRPATPTIGLTTLMSNMSMKRREDGLSPGQVVQLQKTKVDVFSGAKQDLSNFDMKVRKAKESMQPAPGMASRPSTSVANLNRRHGEPIRKFPTMVQQSKKVEEQARKGYKPSRPIDVGMDALRIHNRLIDEKLQKVKLPEKLGDNELQEVEKVLRNTRFTSKVAREQVAHKDIVLLNPGRWLNDEIINFYGALIQKRADEEMIPQGDGKAKKKRDIHYFNSFFYAKLEKEGYEKSRLARWTKKIDIFSKDIVIFPINIGNQHWVCAALNFKDRRIEYYDSLADGPQSLVFDNLRHYLEAEAENKGKSIDLEKWENYWDESAPQQANGYDCGVFTCQTLEHRARGLGDGDHNGAAFEFTQDNIRYIRQLMILEIAKASLKER